MVIDKNNLFHLEGTLEWIVANLDNEERSKDEILKALLSVKKQLSTMTPLFKEKELINEGIYADLNYLASKVSSDEVVEHIRAINSKNNKKKSKKHFVDPLDELFEGITFKDTQ